MAVKDAAKPWPLTKAPGAQFEISIDGTPRTYRDRKAFAIEAAEHLKRKHPNSTIVVRDLQSGEATTIQTRFGAALTFTRGHGVSRCRRSRNRRVHLSRQRHHHLSRYHQRLVACQGACSSA
jgi:FMN-dependent NADH-azoreductase